MIWKVSLKSWYDQLILPANLPVDLIDWSFALIIVKDFTYQSAFPFSNRSDGIEFCHPNEIVFDVDIFVSIVFFVWWCLLKNYCCLVIELINAELCITERDKEIDQWHNSSSLNLVDPENMQNYLQNEILNVLCLYHISGFANWVTASVIPQILTTWFTWPWISIFTQSYQNKV
jgi:hypothetical protein